MIIVLSARTDSTDKVHALDAGADDYVTKPFGMAELLARLRAAVRRAASATGDGEPVTVDLTAKRVERQVDGTVEEAAHTDALCPDRRAFEDEQSVRRLGRPRDPECLHRKFRDPDCFVFGEREPARGTGP